MQSLLAILVGIFGLNYDVHIAPRDCLPLEPTEVPLSLLGRIHRTGSNLPRRHNVDLYQPVAPN